MKKIFYLIVLITIPFSMLAQTSVTLTLQKAIQAGIDNSKQLSVSNAKLEVANARFDETKDLVVPNVKLNASYSRLSNVPAFTYLFPGTTTPVTFFPVYLNDYMSQASANEVIFSGFRLKYAIASARYVNQAASLDVKNDKDAVAFNIVSAYFNLYKLYKTQAIINQNIDEVKQHITETQNWETNGIATHNDVVRWELQESNIDLSRLDIENNIGVANYNLCLLLGLPTDTKLSIDTTGVETLETVKPIDDYQQAAVNSRGDLQSQDLKNKASLENVKIAKNSYWPQISVGGDVYYANPNPRYIPPLDLFKATWDVGINLSFSITNLFTNGHVIDENNGLLNLGTASYNLMSDQVKQEVNQSYLTFYESTERLKVLEVAVNESKENYDLTYSKYKNSIALLTDVIDAQTMLFQAQVNYALGKADAKIAYYNLLKSTGTIQ